MILLNIEKTGKDSGVLAIFSVKIEEWGLELQGLKYIKGTKGTFIAYPAKMTKDESGQWKEVHKWFEFTGDRDKAFKDSAKELVMKEFGYQEDTPEEAEKFWA